MLALLVPGLRMGGGQAAEVTFGATVCRTLDYAHEVSRAPDYAHEVSRELDSGEGC